MTQLPWLHWLAMFVLTHVLIALLAALAPRAGWMDRPGGHKHHQGEVPVIGGLAVLLAGLIVMLAIPDWSLKLRLTLLGMGLLGILGLLDDRFNMSARWRMLAQALIVFGVLWASGLSLHSVGALLPGLAPIQLAWFALPFSVFCLVGVINAYNMVDGMDGLSGSLFVLIAGPLWFWLLYAKADPQLPTVLGLISIGMLAFLLWNWPFRWRIRRVFLGDAGTLPLGFLLGLVLVESSQTGFELSPTSALWLLAWPLIDTVSVLLRRLLNGQSAFSADQRHAHHLLLRAGFSVRETLLIAMLVQLAAVAIALFGLLHGAPDWLMAALFLIVAFSLHGLAIRVERRGRLFDRVLLTRVGGDHV
ncbi:hypothetical protein C7S18_09195 [Ahniella affigens]|uniref:Undecaprenyl-phosphate alpha-N-acetylglucosaminyl 1-phosphate transferase n=1 Tax=Ahniella affigens TaxID=2021234 RepID=A0A2P1PR74_9GAMM|nr:hypothetical protein [Ahniella affigens]AVP97357.1 hypothetical protein C7S18_09195 [Ahniella affigens]